MKKSLNKNSDLKLEKLVSVDIFLPICGEDLDIINKTWQAVSELKDYSINIETNIYVLDDTNHFDKKSQKYYQDLANFYKLNYIRRDNLGYMKKAGNLLNAFNQTKGDFIIIFDADFAPNKDFIIETLPYLLDDQNISIVQTPQVFELNTRSEIEYGASNIQDFFYRIVQKSRDSFGGAICVGTNAIYRRKALELIGGTWQISHSEDVWTGMKLVDKGYSLKYLPICLAIGVSPDTKQSFFKQQTRWCQGSMSLMMSKDFWLSKLNLKQKLCFISGFLFYLSSLCTLLLPIIALFLNNNKSQMMYSIYDLLFYPLKIALIFILLGFIVFPKIRLGTVQAFTISIWSYSYTIISLLCGLEQKWIPTGQKQNLESDKKKNFLNRVFKINSGYELIMYIQIIYVILLSTLLILTPFNLYLFSWIFLVVFCNIVSLVDLKKIQ